MKQRHDEADSISPQNVVHKAKPCLCTSKVSRPRKVSNGRKHLFRRDNTISCDGKTSQIDIGFAKLEILCIDDDFILAALSQIVPDMIEMLFDGVNI